MCGIAGYVGRPAAAPIILEGLRRLEYRGYDSAGIAVLNNQRLHQRYSGPYRQVVYLNEYDVVTLTADDSKVANLGSDTAKVQISQIEFSAEAAERGPFPHFMLKEIFEQPRTAENALRGRIDFDEATAKFGGIYLHAGPEIGVASTKAFTSQVTVLTLLALFMGRMRMLASSRAIPMPTLKPDLRLISQAPKK